MTIKIGMIGCGEIAAFHAEGYLRVGDAARITAISDVVEQNAQNMAERVEHGGSSGSGGTRPAIYNDYHTLISEADVDAVDICLPHHLHKDAIVAAATAGKHILCEKPLCLTLAEAEAISEAIATSGVTLMCAHNQLFLPAIQQAHQLLREGLIGQVYELQTSDAFYHPWNMSGASWRSSRETMGGGELIDTGYHPSYMLLYLAESVPTEVTAMISRHRIHTLDGEDSAQVLVRFANGAVGHIVTSWAYEPPANMNKFSLVGERGQIWCAGNTLYYRIRGAETVAAEFPSINTFHAETADFVSCLTEKRTPIQTQVDGINVLKVILGAYQSVDEKRTIVFNA